MKTLGIGVDIVQNSRIKKLITNEKFLLRIFTNDEINKSKKMKVCLPPGSTFGGFNCCFLKRSMFIYKCKL